MRLISMPLARWNVSIILTLIALRAHVLGRDVSREHDAVSRLLAKKPRADGVKRSRPAERLDQGTGLRAEYLCRDAFDPALHFGSGAAREGEQHHPTRVRARDD